MSPLKNREIIDFPIVPRYRVLLFLVWKQYWKIANDPEEPYSITKCKISFWMTIHTFLSFTCASDKSRGLGYVPMFQRTSLTDQLQELAGVEVNKQTITKAAMNAFYQKVNKSQSLQHRKISYITFPCKALCSNMLIQQTAKLVKIQIFWTLSKSFSIP